ncbi:MAG: mannose-1-phosphate guanylyltransferase, partial [Bacteroidaceae bacterium]|nr:mannose-1-phosphate guanylyltransferase [Bacteroidaceae bacterium]
MSNNNALVIMAGGVGSRFWPMSTTDNPKQFIDVLGVGRTMLQLTVDRFKAYIPTQNMWVMTSELYGKTVAEQLPEIPLSHILLEPCRRNTAPCVAYVAWRIKSENPKANIVVAPSDHLVLNGKE